MKLSSPFIQSAYSRRVRASASGSACAEKLALGAQYALHTSQPLPASQASKNCLATAVIFDMSFSSYILLTKTCAVSGDRLRVEIAAAGSAGIWRGHRST